MGRTKSALTVTRLLEFVSDALQLLHGLHVGSTDPLEDALLLVKPLLKGVHLTFNLLLRQQVLGYVDNRKTTEFITLDEPATVVKVASYIQLELYYPMFRSLVLKKWSCTFIANHSSRMLQTFYKPYYMITVNLL